MRPMRNDEREDEFDRIDRANAVCGRVAAIGAVAALILAFAVVSCLR